MKPEDVVRFVIAAHNAGFTGALTGYRAGNVDAHTTYGITARRACRTRPGYRGVDRGSAELGLPPERHLMLWTILLVALIILVVLAIARRL